MSRNTTSLPEGAGSTGSQSGNRTSASGSFANDDQYTGSSSSREVVVSDFEESNRPERATIVGAALAGAVIGAAIPFMLSRGSSGGGNRSRQENALVTESVVINKPARELYDFWRDFTNLSKFMDNIKSVQKLDEKRSHWVIKAPAGTSVEFDSRVVDDIPGRLISWESEEGASVPNRGRVEFVETSSGGSTNVMATISYDPPAGTAGRLVAKLFHREPAVQAREDLARLKRLMETGSAD
ncbi:MAG TPA: SRPBCC family protein [Allosphingosinicella sp.]|jgi:uncharacterized membrane protein